MRPTINQAIAFQNQLNKRLGELVQLRNQVSTKETRYFGGNDKTVTEPQYDVKKLDSKITKIQNALFLLDSEIKATNAKTVVDLEIVVEDLLSPIE